MSTTPLTHPPATTTRALCLAREAFASRFPRGSPTPTEAALRALLRELGASEELVDEAQRCWRTALSDASEVVDVSDEGALAHHFATADREDVAAVVAQAAGIAALRALLVHLPERHPGEQGFTWEQAQALMSEHGADADAQLCARVFLNWPPGSTSSTGILESEWPAWFRERSRAELLAHLAHATTPASVEVRQ